MLLARIIAPIHSLGPGERIGVWIQGCSKNCNGCISKELQPFDKRKNIPVDLVVNLVKQEAMRHKCDRLTISGGDPFEQVDELFMFLSAVRNYFLDILVYTGFTMAEINNEEKYRKCLELIDVLVDGRYVESENTGRSRLFGSNNQKIYFLNEMVHEEYQYYEQQKGTIETYVHNDKAISVGIQKRGLENG